MEILKKRRKFVMLNEARAFGVFYMEIHTEKLLDEAMDVIASVMGENYA